MNRSTKKSKGLAKLEDIDTVFRALAHSSRRHILLVVHFHGGKMTAGEIAKRFSCKWPTTSRHLRRLRDAGLLAVEKDGRERTYVLRKDRLESIAVDWFKPIFEDDTQ